MSIKPTQPIVLGKPTAHISIICATGALTASTIPAIPTPPPPVLRFCAAASAPCAPIPISYHAPILSALCPMARYLRSTCGQPRLLLLPLRGARPPLSVFADMRRGRIEQRASKIE